MSGHWVRDGRSFYTEQEIIDDFWDNQIDDVSRDFEQWMNETYDAYDVLEAIVRDGLTLDDFIYEMQSAYMDNEFPEICEGLDVETDVNDYYWVEDDDDDSDRAYEAKRDWELDHRGEDW